MPRRKKCPELAYKSHEFIACEQVPNNTQHSLNASVNNRAARVSKIQIFFSSRSSFSFFFVHFAYYVIQHVRFISHLFFMLKKEQQKEKTKNNSRIKNVEYQIHSLIYRTLYISQSTYFYKQKNETMFCFIKFDIKFIGY